MSGSTTARREVSEWLKVGGEVAHIRVIFGCFHRIQCSFVCREAVGMVFHV